MGEKSKLFIIPLILVMFLLDGFCSKNSIYGEEELFDNIIRFTNGTVQEYSIMATFETKVNKKDVCESIFNKLNIYNSFNMKVDKNNNTYCIDFNKKNMSGYIEGTKYGNYNVITVDIDQSDNVDKIDDLKEELNKSLKDRKESIKYFKYLKAKISDSISVNQCNSQILKLLKSYHISNINTLTLENGYTSTAYTGLCNNAIQIDGRLVDFNCSVCRYYSGNYIILGTPEIIKTY